MKFFKICLSVMVLYFLFNGVAYGYGYDILYPSQPDSKQTWFEDFETQKDYDKNSDLKKQDRQFKEQEILQYLQKETKTKQPPKKEVHKKTTVYK